MVDPKLAHMPSDSGEAPRDSHAALARHFSDRASSVLGASPGN